MDTQTSFLKNYKEFILKTHSKTTAKNYLSDINHFMLWFANNKKTPFSPDLLDKNVISEYKKVYASNHTDEKDDSAIGLNALASRSFKRHLSSLRSFTTYLLHADLITENPFEEEVTTKIPDPWRLSSFKNYLYENKASNLTIKYYINDLNAFIRWYSESVDKLSGQDLPQLTSDILDIYTKRLRETLLLSPVSINRKLSSIRRYLGFMRASGMEAAIFETANLPTHPINTVAISQVVLPQVLSAESRIPPIRLFKSMLNPYLNFENKAAALLSASIIKSKLKSTLTSQKKPSTHAVDTLMRGLSGKNIKKEFYAPYSVSTSSYPIHKKVLFHLQHTRPQWYKTYHTYPFVHYLHFGVMMAVAVGAAFFFYHTAIGSAAADQSLFTRTQGKTFVFKGRLFDQNHKPLPEGSSLRLGLYTSPTASGSALAWEEVQSNVKTDDQGNITIVVGSNNPIPDSLFSGNNSAYLGITVNNEAELSPRQELGVPYAQNAGSVQGMEPITSSDRQSNVLLALNGSGNVSIGGHASPVFEAVGGDFTLRGETVILTTNAYSNGNIVLNPNGNGKIDVSRPLFNSQGTVSIEGGITLTATGSASPAVSINQDGAGPIISASSFGVSRFTIDSQGTITRGAWAGNPIGTEFGGFGASITPKSPGEILYSTGTSAYGHLSAGAAGQCLMADGYKAPLWSSCGFLNQLNGALSMTNSTLDFLLGGTSTNSAKFAFTNIGTGTPTFKIGSSLSITSDNLIQADNQDLKIGGTTTKNILLAQAGGNVGVGTTSPTRSIDVNGTWGGNVDYYTDGANNQTITRSTKALVYDLEKSTGGADTSTATIYNITGLPDTDGTFAYLYTKVSKNLTASVQTQTITIQINGFQIGTVSTIPGTASSEIIKHYTAVRSNSVWHLIGDPGNANAADLAEWTPYSGTRPQAGDILSIDASGNLTQSHTAYDGKMAGIVSTNPKITIGQQNENTTPLALSGRIPVIVSSINGTISSGEAITSSIFPGVGMKLTKSGATVGKALESFSAGTCPEVESIQEISWPDDTGTNSSHPCFKIKVGSLDTNTQDEIQKFGLTAADYIYIGKVMVLANVSWSNQSDLIASLDSAVVTTDTPNVVDPDLLSLMRSIQDIHPVVKAGGKTIQTIQAYAGIVAGTIKAGAVLATSISTQNLTAVTGAISNLTAGSIKTNILVSPLARIDTLRTNTITTNGANNLTVNLPSSSSAVVVKNEASNREVAKIDGDGNASFSGQLSSNSLNTTDATVSGTLHAGNIMADNIEGLDSKVSSFAAQFAKDTKPTPNVPSESFGNAWSTASVSAGFGTFYEGLLSLGASTFGNLSVMDQLSIGTTLTLSQNSINTLGTDLNIQPLRQGAVSFLAGAVRIEADGQLSVTENAIFHKNLTVKGNLFAGLISPLPDTDLEVNLPSTSTHESSLVIKSSSSSAVLTVNNKGDVIASGSGTFSKLKFNLVGQAIASSNFTATASGSAGTAILKSNTTELTIIDPLVTNDSLIYITPANNTNNTVLYLMRQTGNTTDGPIGSFTVGVSQTVPADTLFNWLIVN